MMNNFAYLSMAREPDTRFLFCKKIEKVSTDVTRPVPRVTSFLHQLGGGCATGHAHMGVCKYAIM